MSDFPFQAGDIVRRVKDFNTWGDRKLAVVGGILTTGDAKNLELVYRPKGPLDVGLGKWLNGFGDVVEIVDASWCDKLRACLLKSSKGKNYRTSGKSTCGDPLFDLLCPASALDKTYGSGEWVTRDGKKVVIAYRDLKRNLTHPLIADNGRTYTFGGHYFDAGVSDPRDLVGPWHEPTPETTPIPEPASMIKTTTKREFIDGEYMGMEIKNVRNRKAVIDDIIWSSDYLRQQAALFNLLADIADENA